MTLERIQSADGTSIAFETIGKGPALILVGGAFCDRNTPTSGTALAARLVHRFTVISYDRRGRGDSENAAPYAIEREHEDLAALIAAAGGSAFVFGISSGGLLGLDAAARGAAIPKVALYEPPVILDAGRAQSFEALISVLGAAVAGGDRSKAVELFLTEVVQMPAPVIARMQTTPMWRGLERLAHTLSYDLSITARGAAWLDEARAVRSQVLVLDGSASPPWMRGAAQTLARAIPGGLYRSLEGQTHAVDVVALAPALEDFFSA